MTSSRTLLLATKNAHKVSEIKKILTGLDIAITSMLDYPALEQVDEDGASFEENAVKKAVALSRQYPYLVVADDSGITVDALDGAPGIYSSRFAGDRCDDAANNQKLLTVMEPTPDHERTAYFVCTVAIALKGEVLRVITDTVEGRIARALSGSTGFGYDPLFIIPTYNKTFAELGPEVKDVISHRAKAFTQACTFIAEYLQTHQ